MLNILLDGHPLFAGESEIDQLYIIQKELGTLIPSQMRMFLSNPRFQGLKFPEFGRPETLDKRYLGKMGRQSMNFLKSVLCIDPAKRLRADVALEHAYFDGLKEKDEERKAREARENEQEQEKVRIGQIRGMVFYEILEKLKNLDLIALKN